MNRSLLLLFVILCIGYGQNNKIDERGDYYITFIGMESDTSSMTTDHWDGFAKINMDGDSLTYWDLYEPDGDSGRIDYVLDDTNSFFLFEDSLTYYKGAMSDDGSITPIVSLIDNQPEILTAIRSSSGFTEADLSGEYNAVSMLMISFPFFGTVINIGATETIDISLSGDGTGMISTDDEMDTTYFEVQDDGQFILSGDISEVDSMETIAPIFAGNISPDGNTWAAKYLIDDTSNSGAEFSNIMIGSKKGSSMDNASVQGEFLYYEMRVDMATFYGYTKISLISVDGNGMGNHALIEGTPGDPAPDPAFDFSYLVQSDGKLQVTPQFAEKQTGMILDGFVSADGQMFALTYTDTSDGTEARFGIGIKKPSPVDAIGETSSKLAENFTLLQNYPNPFNPETVIRYELRQKSHVELTVYNALGQKVSRLINTDIAAGNHKIVWNAKNEQGIQVASGIYFYRLKTDFGEQIRKMSLIR